MFKPVIIGKHDLEEKGCYDCFYCQAEVSWWCTNQEAIKHRGTRIPGVTHCQWWKPCTKLEDLNFWQRTFFMNNFIKVKGK